MAINKENLFIALEAVLEVEHQTTLEKATARQLHCAVAKWAMARIYPDWTASRHAHASGRRAFYLSAEFLVGRLVYNNLYAMGVLEEVRAALLEKGVELASLEEIEDAALGNGGLGRLAACYLDSAATHEIPLDGYGIRYRYGLFRQSIVDGFQREAPDDWQRFGDPWSVRREEESVTVELGEHSVIAVPYDMPVIGCGGSVNTLRLWQAEAVSPFDFALFNEQKYAEAVQQRSEAEAISAVLYPNDSTKAGKRLRLTQQYFFASASIKDMLRRYKAVYGTDFSKFAESYAVQLNDTHPVIAIPELMRLLMDVELLPFTSALEIARRVFSYTNHTVMPEAMETWEASLLAEICPRVLEMVKYCNEALLRELSRAGVGRGKARGMLLLSQGRVHMARLAVFVCHMTNGVAKIHTEILKTRVLADWYALYPERFVNKTNGITPRRWLGLCNPELSSLFTELLGSNVWLRDLSELHRLASFADDPAVLDRLVRIKYGAKERLCAYAKASDGAELNPDFCFAVQVKRLHEYKRQFLTAFLIVGLYSAVKEGRLTDLRPTAFIFGGKAAPGYARAKGIIKYIGEVARLVNHDPDVNTRLRVAFLQNYNVSAAEVIMPAADISLQVSAAGTEASGTGNMKLSLNGAVTLGTFDGANIEIAERAGAPNNYLFGLRAEEIAALSATYNPREIYTSSEHIRQTVDTLIDGTFDDGGTGMFRELYDSLLTGASWHAADQYFLLADLKEYAEVFLRVNADYGDQRAFARKCLLNIAGCGYFSSDRAVREYADEIWNLPQSE